MQIRIVLEAEAILGVIALCESSDIELVSSEALIFEIERNPHAIRKEYGFEVLRKAGAFIVLNEQIEDRARKFNKLGMQPLDALHLASAEEAEADYFCTCDDKFLTKAKAVEDLKTKVVSPIELIEEIEK